MSWFATWFNSPYYHKLYKNRDETEARFFINNLMIFLNPKKSDKILDLACGKGRHAIFLNTLGFHVEGCDLAPESIAYAKKHQNKTLDFFVHDMRNQLHNKNYDLILNLFTSFGYFEVFDDNLKTLMAVHQALTKNGKLVIDFFNADYVLEHLLPKEQKICDDIVFDISKKSCERHYIQTN